MKLQEFVPRSLTGQKADGVGVGPRNPFHRCMEMKTPLDVGFPAWIHDKGHQLLRECARVVQELTGSGLGLAVGSIDGRAMSGRLEADAGVLKVGGRLAPRTGWAPLCNDQGCPLMCAGEQIYSWESSRGHTARSYSAPVHMRQVVVHGSHLLSDAEDRQADPYLGHGYIRTLCRHLFQVYAHAYLNHYEGLQGRYFEHFLCCYFEHFVLVTLELDLVGKEDLLPLRSVIDEIVVALP